MRFVAALFGSFVVLCIVVALVQSYREARRDGRAGVLAVLEQAVVIAIRLVVT